MLLLDLILGKLFKESFLSLQKTALQVYSRVFLKTRLQTSFELRTYSRVFKNTAIGFYKNKKKKKKILCFFFFFFGSVSLSLNKKNSSLYFYNLESNLIYCKTTKVVDQTSVFISFSIQNVL